MNINQDKPSITQVLGDHGEVDDGGTTEDRNFVVVGIARSNMTLTIYDGENRIDFVQAEEGGDWAKKLQEPMAEGFHELTARAVEDELVSEPWTFTIVTATARPVISHVQDSRGNPIADNGSTQDTIVTLFGTADEPLVEILDENRSWGTAQVAGNQTWNKRLAGLELGSHRFTAKNSIDGQQSPPWSLNVESTDVAPEILRVRDSEGRDIVDGGITEDTDISLSGTAEANSTVEILDEITSWGTTQATLSGTWSKSLRGLESGFHRFRAREVISQLESPPWEFTVINNPLLIDTSPMRLDGFSIYMGWARTENDSPGNTQIRRPTGGRAPYSYSSSNSAIAQVDSDGKVRGVGCGDAIIVVTDQSSRVVSFPVVVTNVYVLLHTATPRTHVQAVEMFEAMGSEYKAYEQRPHDEMVRLYQRPFPFMEQHYWCPVWPGCGTGLALNFEYPEQELGCADPDLRYEVLLLIESGKQKDANFVFFK